MRTESSIGVPQFNASEVLGDIWLPMEDRLLTVVFVSVALYGSETEAAFEHRCLLGLTIYG